MRRQLVHALALGLVGDEADALDLADVVESDDAGEAMRVLLLQFLELLRDLSRVGAPEHGQLPHSPVAPVVVTRGFVVLTVHKPYL